jgi:hypothetical protein
MLLALLKLTLLQLLQLKRTHRPLHSTHTLHILRTHKRFLNAPFIVQSNLFKRDLVYAGQFRLPFLPYLYSTQSSNRTSSGSRQTRRFQDLADLRVSDLRTVNCIQITIGKRDFAMSSCDFFGRSA